MENKIGEKTIDLKNEKNKESEVKINTKEDLETAKKLLNNDKL